MRSLRGLLPKERIELVAGSRIREAIESALIGDQPGGAHESAPGRARKRAPNTDPPDPERGNLLHRELARPAHQQVERLRRHGVDDGPDLIGRPQPRRVQAVGAGLRVGLQPPDGFGEIAASSS
jgi:hypothetical protein